MPADTVHQCPGCELRFAHRTELDDHRRADHAPDVRDDVPAPVTAAVVVPVDPWGASTMAVSVAAAVARQAGLRVDVVTAPPRWHPHADLTTCVEQARAAGVPGVAGEVLAATSDPAAAILDHVQRHRPAMVCMSTRQRSQFGETVLGSVSAGVVRDSPVPVLLVGPRVEHFGPRVERIVACVDGSPAGARAVLAAANLAARLSAELKVVQVVHDDHPARAITRYGGNRGDTVIAMATRHRGALRRLVLGSVTRTVVHDAACPVLVVLAVG